ncbi:mitochondrial fission regulator 2 [Brachionichthys hirsutus]|uniref:mitochondrial fission regulator 2 n=1 Tax=Brachionichthys hirsutus TaxID=412623 RepID=UPI003605066F
MSLVEDILYVLHTVLNYFGVPPEMLVPVWDSSLTGQYRSIVRMIGTNLPLAPAPRVHFQAPLLAKRPHGLVDHSAEPPAVPSLADVLWVYEDAGDSFAKTKNYLPPKKQSGVNLAVMRYPGPAPHQPWGGGGCVRQTTDHAALKKITALENELQKLRAQIATIVTAAPASGLNKSQNAPGTPLVSSPAHTSTPRCAARPPPPPPPPLPPPPALSCPSSFTESLSVLELIRHRKKDEKALDKKQLRPQVRGIPSMLDVLKDLKQVQLRSVERSPGGTPISRRRSKGAVSNLSDPAALLAEALKRKFSQHRHNISSDKENSPDQSPFSSPETPKLPLHARRSQGRLHI